MFPSFLRSDLASFKSYSSARDSLKSADIQLDANERSNFNEPYNRYPDPQPADLKMELSSHYRVEADEIVLTRGADEGIELAIKATCVGTTRKVLYCPPTYGMYQTTASALGVTTKVVSQRQSGAEYSLNIEQIKEVFKNDSIGLVFICRPNNPTGQTESLETVLNIAQSALKRNILVVVDEAYIEYSLQESATTLLDEIPNLVVLRTFSKAYGLAAVRLGALIANREVTNIVRGLLAPYPLPLPSVMVVRDFLARRGGDLDLKDCRTERDVMIRKLRDLNYIKEVYASDTNFILISLKGESDRLVEYLYTRSILIRDRHNEPLLSNHVRITVGSRSENVKLLQAMKGFSFEKKNLIS